jgi:voltage-gated potassium channel Kch
MMFIVISVALLLGAGLYMAKMISDYEASCSSASSAPPWYTDTTVLVKISSVMLLTWTSLGIAAFTQVLLFNNPPRHLSVIESLYLSVQIITTVGYGDLTPSKPEGQVFVACYILVGVTLVAVLVGELLERAVNRASQTTPVTVPDDDSWSITHSHSTGSEHIARCSTSMVASRGAHSRNSAQGKRHEERRSNAMALLRAVGLFLFVAIVGTVFFHLYPGEDKSIWLAFYMSCVTLTSVGFGAIHPQTEGGYLFATVWMLIGVSATAHMVCTFGEFLLKQRQQVTIDLAKEELFKEMDADGSGTVDKLEFLKFEMVRRGHCQANEIEGILDLFHKLDRDGSGELDVEDVKAFSDQAS